jgi:23S rRNA (cytosine1962-C5)-methyltransferase
MAGYVLLDFGDGGRLERWGDVVVARPDSRAHGPRTLAGEAWDRADATFEGRIAAGADGGRWRTTRPLPDRWSIIHGGIHFQVGLAPSGHTGLFPEQASHWTWMAEALRTAANRDPAEPQEVLNLFAYTGGASIALARAGVRVTHVDASRPAVGWARDNAALNGVSTIRWLHEDARRFVDREGRRGRRYDGLLLDPPAFGRGPAGDWQLERDLGGLLEAAGALLRPDPAFVLVNAYAASSLAEGVERILAWALDGRADAARSTTDGGTLWLPAADGRGLATGVFARATWRRPATPA